MGDGSRRAGALPSLLVGQSQDRNILIEQSLTIIEQS